MTFFKQLVVTALSIIGVMFVYCACRESLLKKDLSILNRFKGLHYRPIGKGIQSSTLVLK